MSDEIAIQRLAHAIIKETFPEEELAFSLAADSLVAAQFRGDDIRVQDVESRGEFQFFTETTEALKFIGLLWSTYEVYKKTKAEWRARSEDSDESKRATASDWFNHLVQNGIDEEKAKIITSKFYPDLEKVIEGENEK